METQVVVVGAGRSWRQDENLIGALGALPMLLAAGAVFAAGAKGAT